MPHQCHQEIRIATLESKTDVAKTEIGNLIKRLDNLTIWIRALVITLIPTIISAFGFLFWQTFRR